MSVTLSRRNYGWRGEASMDSLHRGQARLNCGVMCSTGQHHRYVVKYIFFDPIHFEPTKLYGRS